MIVKMRQRDIPDAVVAIVMPFQGACSRLTNELNAIISMFNYDGHVTTGIVPNDADESKMVFW